MSPVKEKTKHWLCKAWLQLSVNDIQHSCQELRPGIFIAPLSLARPNKEIVHSWLKYRWLGTWVWLKLFPPDKNGSTFFHKGCHTDRGVTHACTQSSLGTERQQPAISKGWERKLLLLVLKVVKSSLAKYKPEFLNRPLNQGRGCQN